MCVRVDDLPKTVVRGIAVATMDLAAVTAVRDCFSMIKVNTPPFASRYFVHIVFLLLV